jgi:nitroimidazol reductase NimA-like FMN-containing flavoprotein (pyridoxamine 5'-phosphate oxidase superfamily)
MAKRIIDGNRYLTLATVDGDGHPWATPVYFSHEGYRHMYWISSPETRHSRNLAARSDVSVVIFDSQVPIGGAEAVYLTGSAEEISTPTQDECTAAFRPRFEGVRGFTPKELQPPERLRLYRATPSAAWVLIRGNDPVWGRGVDMRLAVNLT